MTKIKSKCGHEVEKSDTFCGACGEKVVHVELEHEDHIKRCPSCEKPLLTLNVSFCTGCGEKIFICKGKNENGSSCESLVAFSSNFELCKKCRLSVGVQIENNACNDELDSSGQNSQHAVPKGILVKLDVRPEVAGPARGLAVICIHTDFKVKGIPLYSRPSAHADQENMERIWKLYDDCEVLSFKNEGNEFYNEEFEKKIQEKLDVMNVKYFVFVLSTHGDEKPVNGKHYKHFFYTKDGQFQTEDLMTKINVMEKLKDRMKMFFIQACRGRPIKEQDNVDIGFNVSLASTTKYQPPKQQSENTSMNDVGDAIGHRPPLEKAEDFCPENLIESNAVQHSSQKQNAKSIDVADAKGYLPPPEEQSEVENGDNEAMNSETEEIPYCDGCVVVFASMAGKYAYSRLNTPDQGGWMISALYSTLDKHQKDNTVHITDILREINREVSEKDADIELNHKTMKTSILQSKCSLLLVMLKDELTNELENKMLEEDSLANAVEKKMLKEESLSDQVAKQKREDSRDKLNEFYKNVEELLEKVELKMESEKTQIIEGILKVRDDIEKNFNREVGLKAQSCFFHNLAFEDEYLTLHKTMKK